MKHRHSFRPFPIQTLVSTRPLYRQTNHVNQSPSQPISAPNLSPLLRTETYRVCQRYINTRQRFSMKDIFPFRLHHHHRDHLVAQSWAEWKTTWNSHQNRPLDDSISTRSLYRFHSTPPNSPPSKPSPLPLYGLTTYLYNSHSPQAGWLIRRADKFGERGSKWICTGKPHIYTQQRRVLPKIDFHPSGGGAYSRLGVWSL